MTNLKKQNVNPISNQSITGERASAKDAWMQHSSCSQAHKKETTKQQPEPLYSANQATIYDQPSIETVEASKYTVAVPLTNPEATKTTPASHTTGTKTI